MEISIPFNDWSKARLAAHCKRATSRYKKYGNVGDEFIVDGYKYQIELVIKLPLWLISEELYKSEGCVSKKEFIDVWEQIHKRRGLRPFDEVWYHHFKQI